MSERQIPNMGEMPDSDVWTLRELSKDEATWHSRVKRACDDVLGARLAERGATRTPVKGGEVVQTIPKKYAYKTEIVEAEFLSLLGDEAFEMAFAAGDMSRSYEVKQTWLKKLVERGAEWRDVIERMTTVVEGNPTLKGPKVEIEAEPPEADEVLTHADTSEPTPLPGAVMTGGLFAATGGDVNVCEFCKQPLDDSKPWKRGMDGAGAHEECIRSNT